MNRPITTSILLQRILQNDNNIIFQELLMEAEFKSTQQFVPLLVGIFPKMSKIGHSFQPFQHVFSN